MSADDFCLPENTMKIRQRILEVLNCEAPISKNLLGKRVLQSYGIARMDSRLERCLTELLAKMKPAKTAYGENTFYWKEGQKPQEFTIFRVAGGEADKRNAEDVPPEETANAVRVVLMNQIGLPREDLIRETARVLQEVLCVYCYYSI